MLILSRFNSLGESRLEPIGEQGTKPPPTAFGMWGGVTIPEQTWDQTASQIQPVAPGPPEMSERTLPIFLQHLHLFFVLPPRVFIPKRNTGIVGRPGSRSRPRLKYEPRLRKRATNNQLTFSFRWLALHRREERRGGAAPWKRGRDFKAARARGGSHLEGRGYEPRRRLSSG